MWPALLSSALAAPVALPRHPDLHGDTIVFAAGDDLWTVPVQGGKATQLTALPGMEDHPHFTPDGGTVVFSALHDGDREVTSLSLEAGATPRRHTWHAGADRPVEVDPEGWIWFRSARHSPSGLSELFRVPLAGGPVEALGWGMASDVAVGPAGTPAWVDTDPTWGPWDRSLGGLSPHLRLEPARARVPRAGLRQPLWRGEVLWATGEDAGALRLAEVAPSTGALEWVSPPGHDVRDAAASPDGRVVYVHEDELYVLEQPGEARRVKLRMPAPATPPLRASPATARFVRGPQGELALLLAGTAWVHGREGWTPWLDDPDQRAVNAAWDGTGELWVLADNGFQQTILVGSTAPGRTLALGEGWLHIAPSPTGTHLAATHLDGRVLLADLRGPEPQLRELGRSLQGPEQDRQLAWSPNTTQLAFTLRDARGQRSVYTATISGPAERSTPPGSDHHSPGWSEDGGRLRFSGARGATVVWDRSDPAVVAQGAPLRLSMPAEGGPTRLDPDPPAEPPPVPEAPLPEVSRPAGPAWVQLVGEGCRQIQILAPEAGAGLDCAAVRGRAARARSRSDVQRVLQELLGQLQRAHAFAVPGPDPDRRARRPVPELGGRFAWTGSAWMLVERWEPDPRQPLPASLVDAGVPEGACVRAVDGQPVTDLPLLAHLGSLRPDRVDLDWWNCSTGAAGSSRTTVTLRGRDPALLWSDRARRRAAALAAATDHRVDVGYLLLTDLGDRGLATFLTLWPGLRARRWLVLDLRGNGGGWASEAVVSRLLRPALGHYRWASGAEQPVPLDASALAAERILVLIDGATMSEGEVLARSLQLHGALLVGTPTWGGLSGTVAGPPLLDGTTLHVPGVVWVDPEHGLGLEGAGLQPDLPVEDLRQAGQDPWLAAAVAHIAATR